MYHKTIYNTSAKFFFWFISRIDLTKHTKIRKNTIPILVRKLWTQKNSQKKNITNISIWQQSLLIYFGLKIFNLFCQVTKNIDMISKRITTVNFRKCGSFNVTSAIILSHTFLYCCCLYGTFIDLTSSQQLPNFSTQGRRTSLSPLLGIKLKTWYEIKAINSFPTHENPSSKQKMCFPFLVL